MRVEHDSMRILDILSVLKSTTVETNLLTQLCNAFAVKVCKEIQLEDAFSNLRS